MILCDFCGKPIEFNEKTFTLEGLKTACLLCATNNGNYTVTYLRVHTEKKVHRIPETLSSDKFLVKKYLPSIILDYGYNHGRRQYANYT